MRERLLQFRMLLHSDIAIFAVQRHIELAAITYGHNLDIHFLLANMKLVHAVCNWALGHQYRVMVYVCGEDNLD